MNTGTVVLSGEELFKLHDTYGFPLYMSLFQAHKRGMRCDLFGFAHAALKAGWSAARTQSVIRESIADGGRSA